MGELGPKGALAIWCSGRGEDPAAGDGSLDELKLRRYITCTIAVLGKKVFQASIRVLQQLTVFAKTLEGDPILLQGNI